MDNYEPDLQLEAMAAIRGARELQERLRIELSTGSPSISDLAYAVKMRVKDNFKICEKVLRKRNEEGRPDYSVNNLRDIIGLRIVTLYRLDALQILPLLIAKIQRIDLRDPSRIFHNGKIEEIIVYSNNPNGDAQNLSGRIKAICESFNVGNEHIFRIETTPSNYTSIHIVTWGRGKYGPTYKVIPIEIQIRTALEDVWGEIDHSLKYKNKSLGESSDPVSKSVLKTTQSHLNVMKTLVDGLAQYGDQIKIQIDTAASHSLRSQHIRMSTNSTHTQPNFSDVDGQFADEIKECIGECVHFINEMNTLHPDHRISLDYSEIVNKIDRIINSIGNENTTKPSDILYVLNMEKAIVLYMVATKLDRSSSNDLLATCSRIYSSLEDDFPDRAMVKYRFGKCLGELGDSDSALAKFDAIIQDQGSLKFEENEWVKVSALRAIGVIKWERWRLNRFEKVNAEQDLTLQKRDLVDAFACSLHALHLTQKTDSISDGSKVPSRVTSLNNFLFFAVECLEQGIEPSDLDGFEQTQFAAWAAEFASEIEEVDCDYRHWDTLRRERAFAPDGQGAIRATNKVLEFMKKDGASGRGDWDRDEEIWKECVATLEKFSSK